MSASLTEAQWVELKKLIADPKFRTALQKMSMTPESTAAEVGFAFSPNVDLPPQAQQETRRGTEQLREELQDELALPEIEKSLTVEALLNTPDEELSAEEGMWKDLLTENFSAEELGGMVEAGMTLEEIQDEIKEEALRKGWLITDLTEEDIAKERENIGKEQTLEEAFEEIEQNMAEVIGETKEPEIVAVNAGMDGYSSKEVVQPDAASKESSPAKPDPTPEVPAAKGGQQSLSR